MIKPWLSSIECMRHAYRPVAELGQGPSLESVINVATHLVSVFKSYKLFDEISEIVKMKQLPKKHFAARRA